MTDTEAHVGITQAAKEPKPLPPILPPFPVRRFTVDEYHRLIQTGILRSGEQYELIHGWIIPKWPLHPTPASVIRRLDKRLQRVVKDAAVIGVRQPITTADSESEPDLTVSRGPEERYFTRHPVPEDIHFVIEVNHPGPAHAPAERLALYARAMLPICWVVNLQERCVEVFTDPKGGKRPAYKQRTAYRPLDKVPVNVEGKRIGTIAVTELLP